VRDRPPPYALHVGSCTRAPCRGVQYVMVEGRVVGHGTTLGSGAGYVQGVSAGRTYDPDTLIRILDVGLRVGNTHALGGVVWSQVEIMVVQ
jgi:hypothetical protein